MAWVYLAVIAIDGFALVQIMTLGGPGDSHRRDRRCGCMTPRSSEYKFGYACAIGVAMFFLTLSVAFVTLRLTRRDRIECEAAT